MRIVIIMPKMIKDKKVQKLKYVHQITGKERETIAKEMLAIHQGSAKRYRDYLISIDDENIVSV